MQKKKQTKRILLFLFLFGYLLLYPESAISSAREGLLLWYHSVVPVIFPFLFLSNLAIHTLKPEILPKIILAPLTRLFRCSAYGAFVILAGFLCGFPIGAKLTGELYREKKISRQETLFLYGFANNISPGFIFSYLAVEQMKLPGRAGWFLLQILGAALIKGWADAHISVHPKAPQSGTGVLPSVTDSCAPISFELIDRCIYDAVNSVLRLGAYILLFAIISGAVLNAVPARNPIVLVLLSGIEVTNGIRLLAESSLSTAAKYIAVSAAAAFGGLSALAQSAGIARMDREAFFYYIKSRVIITLLAVLLSIITLSIPLPKRQNPQQPAVYSSKDQPMATAQNDSCSQYHSRTEWS